jgi:hypothetical protein
MSEPKAVDPLRVYAAVKRHLHSDNPIRGI